MRNPLSKTIEQIKPSGIRKFFDIVSEMPDYPVDGRLYFVSPDYVEKYINTMSYAYA